MNILITGASGLVGQSLIPILRARGHEVKTLSHQKGKGDFYWDKTRIEPEAFKDLDAIIHLAGASINKRWTTEYKKTIHTSRINTANLLLSYAKKYAANLGVFISASGSSYYGQITSPIIFKEDAEAGTDFLAQICVDWENATYQFEELGARVVCLRTSMVLAKHGGALEVLTKPFKLGLGANLGNGNQWMPWIHIDDLCYLYLKAIEDNNFRGSYNATSPSAINQASFNKLLAKVLHRPLILPAVPAIAVRIALGEMSDLILKGSRLSVIKVEQSGFKFSFPRLEDALTNLLHKD